jgi:colicin import membrane protein
VKEHRLFGLSGWEIAIIALFGFMIFGPDKLPQIARTIGRVLRQFRTAQEQMNKVIKAEVYDPLKDLEPLANPFAGFSLEDSKEEDKKKGSSKTATTAKTATGAKTAKDADAKTKGLKAADKQAASAAGKGEKDGEKPSGDALKAAISGQAEKAKEKAKDAATGAAATGAAKVATESFAQRRARLEREYAQAKAAKTAPAEGEPPAQPTGKPATPDARKEDEKGA